MPLLESFESFCNVITPEHEVQKVGDALEDELNQHLSPEARAVFLRLEEARMNEVGIMLTNAYNMLLKN